MSKAAYNNFINQFTNNSVNNVSIPYTKLAANLYNDATTYDDILDYVTPDIEIGDNSLTFKYYSNNTSPYNKNTESGGNGGIFDNYPTMQPFTIAIKPNEGDTTAIITTPFADSTISNVTLFDTTPAITKFNQYYSSYNEFLIYPIENISKFESKQKFADSILRYANDPDDTKLNDSYQLLPNTIVPVTNLNKNLKYTIAIDYSNLGVRDAMNHKTYTKFGIDHSYDTLTEIKTSDISLEYIDSVYEASTENKINGLVILDTNITELSPLYINTDSTIDMVSENYYIYRQHVPPTKYQNISDYSDYNTNVVWQKYDSLRHIKLNQHNHTQQRFIKPINEFAIGDYDSTVDLKESGFLIEFSGAHEECTVEDYTSDYTCNSCNVIGGSGGLTHVDTFGYYQHGVYNNLLYTRHNDSGYQVAERSSFDVATLIITDNILPGNSSYTTYFGYNIVGGNDKLYISCYRSGYYGSNIGIVELFEKDGPVPNQLYYKGVLSLPPDANIRYFGTTLVVTDEVIAMSAEFTTGNPYVIYFYNLDDNSYIGRQLSQSSLSNYGDYCTFDSFDGTAVMVIDGYQTRLYNFTDGTVNELVDATIELGVYNYTMSTDGTVAMIANYNKTVNGNNLAGEIVEYVYDGTIFSEVGPIHTDATLANYRLGYRFIDIKGDLMIAGCADTEFIYLFKKINGNLIEHDQINVPSEQAYTGTIVDENTIVAGKDLIVKL